MTDKKTTTKQQNAVTNFIDKHKIFKEHDIQVELQINITATVTSTRVTSQLCR